MEVQQVDDKLLVYEADGDTPTTALKNLWRGCSAFLVGGGPSIKQIDYMRLRDRGICSLGINNVTGMVPVKAFTMSDPPEKCHHGIWRDPGIIKFLPKAKLTMRGRGTTREKLPDGSFRYLEKKTPEYPSVFGYERRSWHKPNRFFDGCGLDKKDGEFIENGKCAATVGNNGKEGVPFTGRPKIICSMFLGLRLLHYLGVRRVYLLGADFWMDPALGDSKKGNYAFDEDRDHDAIEGNNGIYRVAAEMLEEMKPIFDAAGFHVFNCFEFSRLRAFPFVPFEEAMKDCRNGVPDEPFSLDGWYQKGERSATAT
jgi:hypothetical protein